MALISQNTTGHGILAPIFVKLQSPVQTSVLGLGVDFVLPLSQQQQEQEQQEKKDEPPPKSMIKWSLPIKTKSCYIVCTNDVKN